MSFTPEKIEEIKSILVGFTGTTQYYKFNFGTVLTDGVKYLFEECGAFWLGDVIVSYQGSPLIKANARLQEFQLWVLEVDLENRKGVVTCREDSDIPPVITQDIEFTDFPLEIITLYCIDKVILLPSEY